MLEATPAMRIGEMVMASTAGCAGGGGADVGMQVVNPDEGGTGAAGADAKGAGAKGADAGGTG